MFGIVYVPRDRTDGIDDASLSLSVTLINLQMTLDGYIDIMAIYILGYIDLSIFLQFEYQVAVRHTLT